MDFVKGRIFKDAFMGEVSKEERRQLWQGAIATLSQLHSIDPKKVGLGEFGKFGGYFDRQLKTLSAVSQSQLQVSEKVPKIPQFEEMIALMKRSAPEDQVTIVHGDFKIDNLIFHPTEPRVIAILDWEMATIGHPLADLGTLMSPWFVEGWQASSPIPSDFVAGDVVSKYGELAGRPVKPSEFTFAVGFNLWKNSVIAQGIAARSAAGIASSAMAEQVGAMTPWVGEMAMKVLSGLESSKL
mmetsp:Transcript_35636/g.93183  ORF Transcript_35636/g.93183 Transcript_35636/m.93183 type:complete len:241 (-) Transcript_35636:371-1093(-)